MNVIYKIELEKIKLQDLQTNHVLHLLLSITTVGIWLIVWIFVSLENSSVRKAAMVRIHKYMEDASIANKTKKVEDKSVFYNS